MVRYHHLWYLLLLQLRDVAVGGVPVMWVCASLGCKGRVGVLSLQLSYVGFRLNVFLSMSIADTCTYLFIHTMGMAHFRNSAPISCSHILHFTQVYILAVQSGPNLLKKMFLRLYTFWYFMPLLCGSHRNMNQGFTLLRSVLIPM